MLKSKAATKSNRVTATEAADRAAGEKTSEKVVVGKNGARAVKQKLLNSRPWQTPQKKCKTAEDHTGNGQENEDEQPPKKKVTTVDFTTSGGGYSLRSCTPRHPSTSRPASNRLRFQLDVSTTKNAPGLSQQPKQLKPPKPPKKSKQPEPPKKFKQPEPSNKSKQPELSNKSKLPQQREPHPAVKQVRLGPPSTNQLPLPPPPGPHGDLSSKTRTRSSSMHKIAKLQHLASAYQSDEEEGSGLYEDAFRRSRPPQKELPSTSRGHTSSIHETDHIAGNDAAKDVAEDGTEDEAGEDEADKAGEDEAGGDEANGANREEAGEDEADGADKEEADEEEADEDEADKAGDLDSNSPVKSTKTACHSAGKGRAHAEGSKPRRKVPAKAQCVNGRKANCANSAFDMHESPNESEDSQSEFELDIDDDNADQSEHFSGDNGEDEDLDELLMAGNCAKLRKAIIAEEAKLTFVDSDEDEDEVAQQVGAYSFDNALSEHEHDAEDNIPAVKQKSKHHSKRRAKIITEKPNIHVVDNDEGDDAGGANASNDDSKQAEPEALQSPQWAHASSRSQRQPASASVSVDQDGLFKLVRDECGRVILKPLHPDLQHDIHDKFLFLQEALEDGARDAEEPEILKKLQTDLRWAHRLHCLPETQMCMLRGLVKSIASEKVPLHYSIGAGVPNRKQHIAAWLKAKRYVYPGDAVERVDSNKAFQHPAIADILQSLLWRSHKSLHEHVPDFFNLEYEGETIKRIPAAAIGLAATAIHAVLIEEQLSSKQDKPKFSAGNYGRVYIGHMLMFKKIDKDKPRAFVFTLKTVYDMASEGQADLYARDDDNTEAIAFMNVDGMQEL